MTTTTDAATIAAATIAVDIRALATALRQLPPAPHADAARVMRVHVQHIEYLADCATHRPHLAQACCREAWWCDRTVRQLWQTAAR